MESLSGVAVALFAKAPARGFVKTRLAADIGDERALELYLAFLADTLTKLTGIAEIARYLYLTSRWPIETIAMPAPLVAAITDDQIRLKYQIDGDLGARMYRTLMELFSQGYQGGIIIGSDSPDLPAEFLRQAVVALEQAEIVIGPTDDGGYYLIGARRELADQLTRLFTNISWSSAQVFNQTIEQIEQMRQHVHYLPRWYDIDTLDDLKRLKQTLTDQPSDSSTAPQTMRCLQQIDRYW